MKLLYIFLFLVVSLSEIARAELYYYKDEKGTLHAVQSPSLIPPKYRQNAKSIGRTTSSAGQGEPRSGQEVEIKLVRKGDHYLVPVNISGTETSLILDTGAGMTMISQRLFKAIKPQVIGPLTLHSASGSTQSVMVKLMNVSVGSMKVETLNASVNDIPNGMAEGLLGIDFLRHFKMRLDADRGVLHLEKK